MKLSMGELVALGVLTLYIAFSTHPPPTVASEFVSNPLGLLLGLGVVGYVGVKFSTIVGVFAAIALLMSREPSFENFDPKEKKKDEQPKSSGVPKPEISGALGRLLQTAGKSITKPPPTTTVTKPAPGPHKEYTPVE
jgi:H+/gluconate symporter-like permease